MDAVQVKVARYLQHGALDSQLKYPETMFLDRSFSEEALRVAAESSGERVEVGIWSVISFISISTWRRCFVGIDRIFVKIKCNHHSSQIDERQLALQQQLYCSGIGRQKIKV